MNEYFINTLKTKAVNIFFLLISLLSFYLYQAQKYVDLDSFYIANMAKAVNSGSRYDAYLGYPYEILAQYKHNIYFAVHNLIYAFHPDQLDIQAILTLVFIVTLFFFYRKYCRELILSSPGYATSDYSYLPLLCTLAAMAYAPYGYASLSQGSTPMYYGLLFYIFLIAIDVSAGNKTNHGTTFKLVALTAICSLIHAAYFIPVCIYFLSDFIRRIWARESFKTLLAKFLPLAAVLGALLFYYLGFAKTLAHDSYEPGKMWPSAWLKLGDYYLASPEAFTGFEHTLSEISFVLLLVLGYFNVVHKNLARNIFISALLISILLFVPPFPAWITSKISEIGFFRIGYPLFTFLIIILPFNIVILLQRLKYKKMGSALSVLFLVSIIGWGSYNIINHRLSHPEAYFDIRGFNATEANRALAKECHDCRIIADSTLAYNLGPLLDNKFLAIMPNRMRHLMGLEKANAIYELNTKILRNPLTYAKAEHGKYVFIYRRNNNLNIEYDEREYAKLRPIYVDANFFIFAR